MTVPAAEGSTVIWMVSVLMPGFSAWQSPEVAEDREQSTLGVVLVTAVTMAAAPVSVAFPEA